MASDNGVPVRGAARIALESPWLSVSLLPACGGIITSLVDRRSGRDWLWRNPHIAAESRGMQDDYGQHLDAGGWDEILLSVAADELELPSGERRGIPDHGDLVRRQWQRIDSADEADRCALTVVGDDLRYEFSRDVRLSSKAPGIEITYSLANHDVFAWPWFWCAHALIAIDPDMVIELPDAQPYRVDSATRKLNPQERIRRWPALDTSDSGDVNLSAIFCRERGVDPFAGKFFVASPDNGAVKIATADGSESLTMRYDAKELPWLGLWINNRGWSGGDRAPYFNLGLEPATAPYDSVSEALENAAVPLIEPGETRQWRLQVEVSS